MFFITPAVRTLLFVTVGIHILLWIAESQTGTDFGGYLSLYPLNSDYFQPYQVLTSVFAHANGSHLFHNMLALFFFGPMMEQVLGSQRFTAFYLICGVCSMLLFTGVSTYEGHMVDQRRVEFLEDPTPDNLIFFITQEVPGGYQGFTNPTAVYEFANTDYAKNPQNDQYISQAKAIVNSYADSAVQGPPLLGASGAVFGILMGCFLVFPNRQMQLLFPPIPIKIKYLVAFYACYEVYALIQQNPTDNVAHLAHLGGMLFAYLLVKYWKVPTGL